MGQLTASLRGFFVEGFFAFLLGVFEKAVG
jgi:hypothetical protein